MNNRQLLNEVLTGAKSITDLKEAKRIGFIYQCITTLNGVPVYEDIFGSVNFDCISERNRINKATLLTATNQSIDKITLVFRTEKDFPSKSKIRKWTAFGADVPICGYNWISGIYVEEILPTKPQQKSIFNQDDWDDLFAYALTLLNTGNKL